MLLYMPKFSFVFKQKDNDLISFYKILCKVIFRGEIWSKEQMTHNLNSSSGLSQTVLETVDVRCFSCSEEDIYSGESELVLTN